MRLGHVAVFTADTEKSMKFYELLGGKFAASDILDIGDGKSKKLTHMVFDGGGIVELVEPSDKEMLLKNPGVCEHFCFNVEDVEKVVKELKAKGVDTFDADVPYEPDVLRGIRIIFLTGPDGELIELYQKL